MHNRHPHTPANRTQLRAAEAHWKSTLYKVLSNDFYGHASLNLTIADGTIQTFEITTHQTRRHEA